MCLVSSLVVYKCKIVIDNSFICARSADSHDIFSVKEKKKKKLAIAKKN